MTYLDSFFSRRVLIVCTLLGVLSGVDFADAASLNEGDSVVVVYNKNLPESLAVAEHYALKRKVPSTQVIGLDLPSGETISREVYADQLEKPLRKRFRDEDWFEFDYEVVPASRERVGGVIQKIKKATVRYLALCYGVPLRVSPEKEFVEEGSEDIRIELRRNEAAVDNELATLPLDPSQRRIYGPLNNFAYGATNSVQIRPELGVLMVARLDGPTPKIAKGLVDLALQAEEDGLWGRAYFDLRGITSGEYKVGDDWIARAAEFSRQVGIETYVDKESATLAPELPVSDIAFYAGWYDGQVSGPFTLPSVDLMPGAILYHLHSFSASTIRSTTKNWVGPLLDRGATATMGCVYEPYLALTPNLEVFFSRIYMGFNFAEAAYASLQAVSWQATVVGDPLYRPFGKPLNMLQAELAEKRSPLIEWLGMMNVNRTLVGKNDPAETIKLMNGDALVQMSSVLTEKKADLMRENGQAKESVEVYQRALQLKPKSSQALRIRLRLAALKRVHEDTGSAVQAYLQIAEHHPDYVGLKGVLGDALGLARRLNDSAVVADLEQRLEALSPESN